MDANLLVRNIAAHWIQAGVVVAASLSAMRLLHVRAPGYRLIALQLTLVTALLLPLMQPYVVEEQFQVPVPASDVVAIQTKFFDVEIVGAPSGPWPVIDGAQALLLIVIAGVALRLTWLACGVIRLVRFSRRTPEVEPPLAASALETQIGVSARYILQRDNRGPWSFGAFRPTIALPAAFATLAPDFQRAILCHELLHVKRRDIAAALGEELIVAALWFHPWVWLLRARIRAVREQVVDARVVEILGNRDEYVRCLVNISGHDLAPHFSQAGAGMLRARELRARVDAIFHEAHMSTRHLMAVTCALLMAIGATTYVAGAALPMRSQATATLSLPQPRSPMQAAGMTTRIRLSPATNEPINLKFADARRPLAQVRQAQAAPQRERRQINKVYPEYPQDALERGIQGTVVVDITINAAGDVTTAAVASGPQELRASAFKAALGLKYTPGPSTTAMKIAFHFTLSGSSWGVRIADFAQGITPRPPTIQGAPPAPGSPDATGAYRVGGDIPPPKKIKDVPPVYPAVAQEARVQGVVIMEARIDEQGNVSDVRTLRSIPLLDQAAIDAVRQWQYTPMLMNGVAVPVLMTVTVNFSLRPLFEIQLTLPDGSMTRVTAFARRLVTIEPPGIGRIHFQVVDPSDESIATVSLFAADGQVHLGNVELTRDAPAVQSPTSPSFGMQFVGFR